MVSLNSLGAKSMRSEDRLSDCLAAGVEDAAGRGRAATSINARVRLITKDASTLPIVTLKRAA